MGNVIHIVLFKWKSALSDSQVKDVSGRIRDVASVLQPFSQRASYAPKCSLSRTTAYIPRPTSHISSVSPAAKRTVQRACKYVHPSMRFIGFPDRLELQKGLTHGFVMEFASLADRDYYITKDQTHAKVGGVLLENSEDITVVDYEAGVF